MKTLLIMLSLVALSLGVSAQSKEERHEAHNAYRSRVIVVPSLSYGIGYGYPYGGYFGYPYFGYPYYGYPFDYPFGYPGRYYNSRRMPYKLSLQIQTIKQEYSDKIRDARKDKSISRAERKKEIRSLRDQRDKEILNTEKNFSQQPMNTPNPGTYNQGNNNDNSSKG